VAEGHHDAVMLLRFTQACSMHGRLV